MHRTLGLALVACGLAVVSNGAAQASDESPWGQDIRSAIRLIAGNNKTGATTLRAGIEVKLQPGWKTYWRYPGDSGVPPHFDFSGSENLKSATVLYPAPHLFTDETGQSLGYKDKVIFPIAVSAQQPDKPVKLRAKVEYAVCEKLCVPAEGSIALTLAPGDSAQDAALTAAEARVPKQMTAAQAGLTAHRIAGATKPLVAVDLPAGQPVEIFAEGPTPDWALPIPKPAKDAPAGRNQFVFELDGLPPGTDPKGKFDLTFTVVTGERAVEVKTHLD